LITFSVSAIHRLELNIVHSSILNYFLTPERKK
jgi:hypothetical protein